MGYTENQIERAGWGLLGWAIKWMFIAMLVSIPLAIAVLVLGWPFFVIWKWGGHQWYWLTLAILAEIFWLSLPIAGLVMSERSKTA